MSDSCDESGKEDSIDDTPSSKAKTAPPRGPTNVGGGGSVIGDPRSSGAVRTGAPVKALPIEAPKLPLADLNKMTGSFGSRALIGDGSYCQVYYAKLSDEQEAIIKKLDTGSSPEPDSDFTNQLSVVSRLKNEYIVELLGYCLEENNRILVYEYAPMGSLHDVLHAHLHSTRVLGTFGYHAPEYAMMGQISQKSDVYSLGVVLLELLTGRKPVDHTLPKGEQSLVTWATPKLSEDKVKQCVDPKLNNDYPPKAVAKLAAVAALCIQYEADFRPNMTIVVKALRPLVNAKPARTECQA
ncbi:hypothetical protein L1987_13850 [Smallanthus sonchifolius]|uniref:Uncharacterized protein n=1 Tax=Smallanthus sonchifolius TaxID=185202 RepID=A0ACB9JKD3_9ASTR|nr:hypothetical protein L1987_13850 [Smallanthus sonchifolius]